jgi:Coenzyme PQQ synthesis protein D (PqqD)
MPDPQTRLLPRTDRIAATVIDGETVIVNLSTGTYYSLTGAGSEAWTLLEQGHALSAVADMMAARFEVSAGQAAQDLERLVAELLEEELVSVAGTTAGVDPPILEGRGDRAAYETPRLEVYRDMEDILALDPPLPGLRDVPWQGPEGE